MGFWISSRLWEVVAYERWSHLEVQLYLGRSYLFFTETLFALFFSTVWIKCYFRPQGLVFFVMKDSRVTFKGKTSPGGRSINGRGRGRREKSERAKEQDLGTFPSLPSPSPLFRRLPLRSRKRSCIKVDGIGVRRIRTFPFSSYSIRLRLRR